MTVCRVISLSVLTCGLSIVTGVLFQVTLISAFAFPSWPPDGVNVFFALVIVLICGSHLVLVCLTVLANRMYLKKVPSVPNIIPL